MAVASSSLKSHYDVIFGPSMLLHYYKLSVDGVGHVGVGFGNQFLLYRAKLEAA